MTSARLILSAAIVLPAMVFDLPAIAATAHNLETGAHTKNANDTAQTATMKQMKPMKKMHRKM